MKFLILVLTAQAVGFGACFDSRFQEPLVWVTVALIGFICLMLFEQMFGEALRRGFELLAERR
jgi:H+/gluconate symporter-like permease